MDAGQYKPQTVIEITTSAISALTFFLMSALNWFVAYSNKIMIVSSILLLASLLVIAIVRNSKIKVGAHYSSLFWGILLVFSLIGVLYENNRDTINDSNKSLCDYTEEALEEFYFSEQEWSTTERIKDNSVRYYEVFWKGGLNNNILLKIFDRSRFEPHVELPIIRRFWDIQGSKTSLALIDTEGMNYPVDESILSELPYSVNLTVVGVRYLNSKDWNTAIEYLTQARKQGNGVACYYLYTIYHNGLGFNADEDEALNYLKQSADLGYRRAQQLYGNYLLDNGNPISVAKGLKYLNDATILSSFRTGPAMSSMHRAIEAIQPYYIQTGQFNKAYHFSKHLVKSNGVEYLNYQVHLDNCLLSGHYSEAYRIASAGMRKKDKQEAAYCRVVLARMYSQGLGVERNVRKAESLLRVASDSLDYNSARKALSELYSSEEIDDSQYWRRLYDINYQRFIQE